MPASALQIHDDMRKPRVSSRALSAEDARALAGTQTLTDLLADPGTSYFVLLKAARESDARLVERIAALVSRELDATQGDKIDSYVRKLTEMLVNDQDLSSVDRDMAEDNAALRAEYLRSTPCYTAPELNRLCNGPKGNKAEPGSRWLREGKLFAVKHGRENRFPAFQLQDGAPNPVIAAVLAALPDGVSPWQVAFWFASGNGWLDGRAPESCLHDKDAVIAAAQQVTTPAVG